jgi:carbonic anhydrase
MEINQIFTNNQKWIKTKLKNDPDFFSNLVLGQTPKVLYIGCSDSRVTAEELMGAKPGEVFVYRNIANMVNNTDLSAMSVINYAVNHLKVKHIVVCGHYYCEGVKAALLSADQGLLSPWLRSIRDVCRLHKAELDFIADEDQRYKRLIELNVQEQCVNVIKNADVQKGISLKNLQVHGWVFDLQSGELIDMKINSDQILNELLELYRLV